MSTSFYTFASLHCDILCNIFPRLFSNNDFPKKYFPIFTEHNEEMKNSNNERFKKYDFNVLMLQNYAVTCYEIC